ncbi:MAG: glycosyltransferase [Armatimonadetes bacterium]|nr:glycosyltransferase [Armatimonadota bacterium]
MNSLIFVSLENWDDIWRRNQFICAELSRRHPDRKILFVGLPHDVSHSLRRGRFSQLRADAPQSLPEFPNIFFFRPVKWWPNALRKGQKANEASFRRQVRAAARGLGFSRPLLWINAHSAAHLVGEMGECGVIYDITDDWTATHQSPAAKQLIIEQDADLCRRADATIVCSQRLFEMKSPLARRLFLVPNGVDLQHYAAVADGTSVADVSTEKWNHPVLGYIGTIHPERVDVALVETIAQAFPLGTIALVGPNLLREADLQRLAPLDNVVVTGAISYQRVPHFLAAFDVCLVPHLESQFTESLNPIKLWEYLATGKPVVSTNVAGFRDFSSLCHIASGAEAFVEACKTALAERDSGRSARLQAAAENSWDTRVDQIEDTLALVSGG